MTVVVDGKRWETVRLGEIAEFRNGLNFTKSNFGLGLRVIGVRDFQDYSVPRYEELDEINPAGIAYKDSLLQNNDILFVRSNGNRNLIGRSLFITGFVGRVSHSGFTIRLRFRSPKAFPRFYAYLLRTPIIRRTLSAYGGGTNINNLNQKILAELQLPLPPLTVQHKISAILSAYDDLIENNLRRIKILEEMAQTLYREWFVKFRFPGHQKVKMVNSPLGKIPEGWEVKPLESLISEHIGGGWGKEEPDGTHTEPAFVVRGTDIPDARRCNISNIPYRYHTLSNLRPRQLTAGDIIFEVSGGSKGQPVGRTLHISSEFLSAFAGERVICASFCKRIKPDVRLYASEILYLSFLEAYDSGEIEQFQVQSTGISNFKWTEYIQQTHRGIPPDALQARFRELANPLFSQIATLGLKNRNLRQTRDLLLPKLISGELDVSELDIKTANERS